MSRFVRASKYRHVFGQAAKKEYGVENVKVTNSAWDTNIISASAEFISINWNASGGGAFSILPLPSPFQSISGFSHKLPDSLPLARSHTAPVLDTDWSPHDDSVVASGAEDGKLLIWKVDRAAFDGWGSEGWTPIDFDPVWRIDASPRKIGQVLWHPTATNVVASASGEHTIKLWDLAQPEDPRITLTGHTDAIQNMAFSPTGTLLVTTCRDRKLRMFDPRAGGEAVRVTDGHAGIKGSRLAWMGDLNKFATTGFSKMSDRQVGIWDVGSFASEKTTSIDQSAGVMMPFWSDNNILFLAGKGDGNIRYYEYESGSLFALDEHKSADPQRGMCFLPRRALNVSECEIARSYKVSGNYIEPIAFIVPRRADSFQSDIFPPAPSKESSISAADFFAGKAVKQKVVSLDSGVTSTTTASSPSVPAAVPPPQIVTPSYSAPPPAAAPAPAPTPTRSYSTGPATPVVAPSSFTSPPPSATPAASNDSLLKTEITRLSEENTKLVQDLREAREKIRGLELALESSKANARKAAALLDQ